MRILDINIGQEIHRKLKEKGMTKASFASALNIHSAHVNRIFVKSTIDTGKLAEISRALSFNFFTLYTDTESPTMVTHGDPPLARTSPEDLPSDVPTLQREVLRLRAQLDFAAELLTKRGEAGSLADVG